jgi:hypothetical protein
MHFVGRTGLFVPVLPPHGAVLYRVDGEKRHAVVGTKGYMWLEADMVKGNDAIKVDMSYFQNLVDTARKAISKYGDFEEFVR